MKRLLIIAMLCTAPAVTWAQDTDDELDIDLLGDEEPASDDSKRLDRDDDLDFEFSEEEADNTDLTEDHNADDLLDGEDTEAMGSDNAQIFKEAEERVQGFPPDEEVIFWERYLEVYGDSVFRDRIDKRIAELLEEVYDERIVNRVGVDAGSSSFRMSQSLEGESIKPEQRLRFGFGWGLPNFINLMFDYEHKLADNLSLHAGLRNRYTGFSVELGSHWAFVQSERTRTVVTGLFDMRLNANPAFVAFRPQLAFGKRFSDKFDLQVQQGFEVEARKSSSVRLVGLLNLNYRLNDSVAMFAESSYEVKNITWPDGGPFAFHVVSFGIRFYPSGGAIRQNQMEAMVGASAPGARNYLGYHVGAIAMQGAYYLD